MDCFVALDEQFIKCQAGSVLCCASFRDGLFHMNPLITDSYAGATSIAREYVQTVPERCDKSVRPWTFWLAINKSTIAGGNTIAYHQDPFTALTL